MRRRRLGKRAIRVVRKGSFSINKVIALIMSLAMLVILLLFLVNFRKSTLKIIEDSECKSSIAQHAFLMKTTGEALVTDIYCPTKYYTLPVQDEQETKKYIADSLKTCWGVWGRGELHLFKEEGYYCHICSVIDFKGSQKNIEGLRKYLVETPIASASGGTPAETITYMDYLAGYSSKKANPELVDEIEQRGFSDSIDTSKKYAVMFVYAKGNKFIKKLFESYDALGLGAAGGGITLGLGAGAVTGVAAGAAVATVATGGVALVAGGLVAGIVTATGGIIGFLSADDIDWVAVTLFTEYSAESLDQIGCRISPARQDKETDELG